MRSDLLCRAEKFVDVAFAITDNWIVQKLSRLLQIVQPPDAFLLFDGNSRRVDLFLERGGPFEFLSGPEFDGRQPERQPLGCYREARMHQDAANRVRSQATRLVPSAVYVLGYADRLGALSLVCEFGRVMQDQNEAIGGSDTITRRLKGPARMSAPWAAHGMATSVSGGRARQGTQLRAAPDCRGERWRVDW